jgi:hypothetical protein
MLKVESILTVDLTTTRAQAKGVAPSASCEGGQTESVVAMPISMLPPPSTDGVDRLYRQQAEIHAITVAQLVECTHWCCSHPTSSLVHAWTDWQRPTAKPSVARMASPPTGFLP